MSGFQRLGKNKGGYLGERVAMSGVLAEIARLAKQHGWLIEELSSEETGLFALRRVVPVPQRRIYVSSGIHGDEPAGPLAVRELLAKNRWAADADVWICPCLNPAGFACGTRENAAGVDLNRDYREPLSVEVRAHVRWLQQQPRFDFALCLHEDWESPGFYLYEQNPERREPLAPRILPAVAKVCPIYESPEIEGRPAVHGVILADDEGKDRPLWPEALYLTEAHTAQSCTLEAPSDFALSVRVAALVAGVQAMAS